jgi:hypothetical protein
MKASQFLSRLLGAAVLVGVAALPAIAQITTGTVTGTIKDEQGLAVPGATVVLVSETRQTRSAPAITGNSGDFVFPNVSADTYAVEVTMDGFRTTRRGNVAVSGGDRVGVGDLTLSVGGASETVTVTGDAPLIQSQSGERSFRITATEVENLPIGTGRNFATLTALTPGVTGTTTRLGGGGQNNIMMDGVSTMDTGNNGQLLQMNPEAIAEVKVLTAGYQAEYGRSSGLQITAVTKGGSNQFHGSLYGIMRNSDWNSNSWVNQINGTPKQVAKDSDYGYSFGGPVGRPGGDNKLFFFYSQEYRPRTSANILRQFRVPTALERQGDFSQTRDNNGNLFNLIKDPRSTSPCTAANTAGCFQDGGVLGRIPQDRLYQTGINILKLWPEPNITQAPGTNHNLEFLSPQFKTLSYQPAVRVDYQFSSKLRMTGKYTGQKGFRGTTPGTIPGFNDTYNAYPWVHAIATTVDYALGPTTFVEVTYGFSNRRLGQIVVGPNSNRFDAGLGALPQLYPNANIVPDGSYNQSVMEDVAPPFFVNGRAELAPTYSWGNRIGAQPPNLAYPAFLNTNPTQDVSISVTKLLGRHTMKTGFYSNHSRKQQNLNQRNALPFQGQLAFDNDTNNPLDTGFGFANAAVGVYTAYTQQSSFVEGKFVYSQIEGYIQDNWRVNNKLTLDYGVRLTHQQPQYDANGQASNFFLDRYSRSAAPAQYAPGCPNNVFPCEATRQAMNPTTGQLMGPGTAALIGQIVPNTGDLTNGIVRAGDGISKYNYEWPKLAAAPRFGAAYSVKDDQSLVIRGGVGLFYDRPDGDSIYYQSQNPPTSTNQTVRNGQLQTLGAGNAVASLGVPTLINYRYDNPKLPQSVQWNVGTQMVMPFAMAADVSYVGQHASHVHQSFQSNSAININAVDFGAAFLPVNQDPTRAPSAVPGATAYVQELLNPIRGYENIDQQWQSFDRTFHSMQFSLTRRFRDGYSFGANYTLTLSDKGTTGVPVRLQHAADGSYSVRDDQEQFNELMSNPGLQRHIVKANFVWDLPNMDSGSGVGRKITAALANDWQISGILTAGSAAPYDVTVQYQNNGANVNLTGSPDYAPRVVINGDTGSGCSGDRFNQFNTAVFSGPLPGSVGMESGRNYLKGCADHRLDMAIARSFNVGSGRLIQLRMEMYNALNAVIYNSRVTQLQLVSPQNQTIRNSQFLANGDVDPARVRTTAAGFGAVNGAMDMRAIQLQVRFQF